MKVVRTLCAVGLVISMSGCARLLNPFYQEPSPVAFLGSPNDHALNESGNQIDAARAAFESRGAYQRTNLPQPVKPVLNPAIVRLMWIPDHLNKVGDLVPAHYYYLKVMDDSLAPTDAFELEGQLNASGGDTTSSIPFQYENDKSN